MEVAALRNGKFDAALLLPNSFRAAWTVRRAGIPERWGYAGNLRGWLLTRAIARPRAGRLHQSEYYRELVRGLGLDAPESLPRLSVRPETAARADALLVRNGVDGSAAIVGFAPGAAYGHAKRWPPRRVADVVTRVSKELGAVCVLVGAQADRDAAREIESSLPADVRPVNLVGRTDLRLLAGVLARCAAFVSNDSGAMHLAAAIGVPVAAIFGPTDDRVTEAARRSRCARSPGILPPLHAARLPHRSPLHEGDHGRRGARRRSGAARAPGNCEIANLQLRATANSSG